MPDTDTTVNQPDSEQENPGSTETEGSTATDSTGDSGDASGDQENTGTGDQNSSDGSDTQDNDTEPAWDGTLPEGYTWSHDHSIMIRNQNVFYHEAHAAIDQFLASLKDMRVQGRWGLYDIYTGSLASVSCMETTIATGWDNLDSLPDESGDESGNESGGDSSDEIVERLPAVNPIQGVEPEE